MTEIKSNEVTLRELLEVRIGHLESSLIDLRRQFEEKHTILERSIEDKFKWLEGSTQTVASAMEKRLDGMNEFRDALRDQTSRMATRDELDELKKHSGEGFTRKEHEAFQQGMDKDIQDLRRSRDRSEGMATQSSVILTFIVAAIGAITGIVAIIVKLVG